MSLPRSTPHSSCVTIKLTEPVIFVQGSSARDRVRRRRAEQRQAQRSRSREPTEERGRSQELSALNDTSEMDVSGPRRGRSAPRADGSGSLNSSTSNVRGSHEASLSTFSPNLPDSSNPDTPTTLVRGLLTLRLSKPSKIKCISVKLKGICKTEWPDGIGPMRLETLDETELAEYLYTLFDASSIMSSSQTAEGRLPETSLSRNHTLIGENITPEIRNSPLSRDFQPITRFSTRSSNASGNESSSDPNSAGRDASHVDPSQIYPTVNSSAASSALSLHRDDSVSRFRRDRPLKRFIRSPLHGLRGLSSSNRLSSDASSAPPTSAPETGPSSRASSPEPFEERRARSRTRIADKFNRPSEEGAGKPTHDTSNSTPTDATPTAKVSPTDRTDSKSRFSLASISEAFRNNITSRSESRGKTRRSSRERSRSKAHSIAEDDDEDDEDQIRFQGWKEFPAGTYVYPISIPIPATLPPTIDANYGSVAYTLKAAVSRAGALKSRLTSVIDVTLVSSPNDQGIEENDSIVVERSWDTQMEYHVGISGKSFPVGGTVPVTIRLSPMDKVKLYRISAVLEQKTSYFTQNRKLVNNEPLAKFNLVKIENKNSDEPLLPILTDNLDEHPLKTFFINPDSTDDDTPSLLYPFGPWNLEYHLQLPDCNSALEFSTVHDQSTIEITHVLKIILRVERGDTPPPDEKSKRKLWDVIVEAPVNILSCLTSQNLLPAYSQHAVGPDGIPLLRCAKHVSTNNKSNGKRLPTFSPHLGLHRSKAIARQRQSPPPNVEDASLLARLLSGEELPDGETPPPYDLVISEHDPMNVPSPQISSYSRRVVQNSPIDGVSSDDEEDFELIELQPDPA